MGAVQGAGAAAHGGGAVGTGERRRKRSRTRRQPRTVEEAIRAAEAVLPGRMAPNDQPDPRWQALFDLKEFIETDPEPLWLFVARWGRHRSLDLRMGVACVLLEHLLPPHFELLFPRVRDLALANERFARTLDICGEEWFRPRDRRRLVRLVRQARRVHGRLSVVRADAVDAPTVRSVIRLAFAEHRGHLDPPSGVHTETLADVRTALACGGAFLAFIGGEIAGCARWRLAPDHVHCVLIGVLPAFRHRGVGAELMAAVEEVGRAAGQREARVAMREQLAGNRRFYEGLGYGVMRRERHPRGADMVLWLSRQLDAPPPAP